MSLLGLEEELKRQLRVSFNDAADHLATGGAKDYAEYRYMTGVVQGLALAERALLDLMKIARQQGD